ncbi:MAG: hypothetical protein GX968_02765, partial [Tissierellia bacterium]|nr:hypothetical protein [Tissierellia bacterium]
ITGKKFDEVDFINGLENIGNVKVKEDEATTTDKPLDNVLVDMIGSEGFETDGREDKVIHFTYEVEGATYKKEPVISIDRYIAAYVGDRTEPHTIDHKPVFLLDDVLDSISFKVPKNDVDKPTEVNVILVMQTEIITSSGTHTIVNVLSNDEVKYTILPSHTKPTINRVIPDKIQVIKSGTDYRLKEDMIIAIEGENFKVIRTKDTTNYPIIGLGADLANSEAGIVLRVSPENEGQIDIRKGNTWTPLPGANITIIDNKGNIIDGTLGKDVGNKIIISLPRSENIKILDTVVTTNPRNPKPKPVYVRNPVLGSQSPGEAVSNDRVTITFVDLQDNPSPTIDRIFPNVVAIDSGEEVTVTGSNFQTGIRVFVGGVEVTGVKHELDPSGLNTILKFNAPKFPQIVEGPTKLTVMNLDGGQASKDFTYVKSLQRDPNLMDFSPKSGTMGTVVIVDGDNFLAPNPAVSNITGMGIYRLIGSRILMDGKDINEYIIDNNGNISLEKYTNPLEHLVYEKDNVAKLADYGHSIVLVEKNNQNSYYTIYYDNRFNIILSDGGIGTEENNIINQYIISYKDGELIGEKDGQIYEVETSEEGIILKQNNITALDLIMKTPYKFHHETKEIYGSKVHVIDKNRIEFTVPNLTSKLPGGYKITVENPDTKKSTAKDLFYYYETVSLKPEITDIKPSIGSIEGGYQILIEGNNFEDDSKVYIDGILVPANDVKREIRSGQDTLIITKMPPYRRNMPEEETDRKVVPVVVENGNGGTALGRFTYVIPPSARPIVDKVEFQKETQIGSAAGDEVLTITGRYFKFEEPWSTVPKYRGWKQGKRKDGTTIYYEDLDKDDKHTSYESWIDYREQEKDNEERIKPLPNTIETYKEYLDSPVLPTIRIGGIEAKIVEFGTNYIKVITPQITPGRHELYVVNNDFGTSNRVMINFQGSKITIDKIVGDTGKKQGKDAVEILGSGFQNTNIRTLENGNIRQYNMPKVRFGTVGGTKDINNNRAQITLEGGDFTIEYDYSNTKTAMITMTAKYNKEIYKKVFTMENYDGEPIYLPTWELRNLDGMSYPGYELVKIETKNRKLIVEKGYSPETELINPGQIALKTPSYYTVGDVQVEVTNPDGGRGTTRYRYTNPASKPRITNITRDGMDPSLGDDGKTRILRLDYRGGQNIVVLGEDFREGARIQIGNVLNIENKDIVETLNATPNKLAFIMPQVNENAVGKLYRVTVINGDGAQASSDNPNNIWNAPIYIQFIKGESDPELGSIVPDKGPATGGTKVTIKGKDFREKMEGYEGEDLKIFFGGTQVPKKDIRIIDHNTIEVVAPESSTLGQVRVKIENPDGSLTQQNLIFTYISKPKIDDVNPKKIFINDTETEVTIKGRQFLPGAKVIVGGKIIPIKDLKSDMDLKGQGITGVDAQGNNREVAVIGGMEAASVNLVDGELKVRFNQATDLENSSLIIINPDGGISDPYDDFKYEKPLPLKPMVLEG